MNSPLERASNLADFTPAEDEEGWTVDGRLYMHRRDATEREFWISGQTPYPRYPRSPGELVEFEQGVLYIDEVRVSPGSHLGTAALEIAIEEGRAKGCWAGRANLVNPRMVDVLENLRELGVVSAVYYGVNDPPYLPTNLTTTQFTQAPDLLTAEEATRRLLTMDEKFGPNRMVPDKELVIIDCVFEV